MKPINKHRASHQYLLIGIPIDAQIVESFDLLARERMRVLWLVDDDQGQLEVAIHVGTHAYNDVLLTFLLPCHSLIP